MTDAEDLSRLIERANKKKRRSQPGAALTGMSLAAYYEGADHARYSEVNAELMDLILQLFRSALKPNEKEEKKMPYCRKCGKMIPTDTGLCDDCRNDELIFGGSPFQDRPADPGSRMDGFPKALVSAILGGVALVFIAIVYAMAAGFKLIGALEHMALSVGIPAILAIAGIVVSVIFGVKSIQKFVDSKRNGKVKPIATLVCGIVGCVLSGMAALYVIMAIPIFVVL